MGHGLWRPLWRGRPTAATAALPSGVKGSAAGETPLLGAEELRTVDIRPMKSHENGGFGGISGDLEGFG